MSKTIGFIGAGNMGSALIGGMIRSGYASGEGFLVYDPAPAAMGSLKQQFGVRTAAGNREVARQSDYLILAIKPNMAEPVLSEIADVLRPETVIVSILAGASIAALERHIGKPAKIVRTLPNTPALVGEGMTAICPNALVEPNELEEIVRIFASVGKAEVVPEKLMDAVTAVSGSSPAYIFMMIEAMADGAVQAGMPRAQAYRFAAQAVLGSARMVLDTELHPGVLKDRVCSPGGTTIDAVAALEREGFRNAILSAVKAAAEKSARMGNQ